MSRRMNVSRRASRIIFGLFCAALPVVLFAFPAMAQQIKGAFMIDDAAENAVNSVSLLPGLLTSSCYLLGTLFGCLGVFKLKDHVENASQTPLRSGLVRLGAGGGMFALPIIYESMFVSVNGSLVPQIFDPEIFSFSGLITGLLGGVGMAAGNIVFTLNGVMANIIQGVDELPGAVTAVAYLLGIVAGSSGVLKLKDHVENPEQNPMREGVTRLSVGGCMFALPAILNALAATIDGGNGIAIVNNIRDALGSLGFVRSGYTSAVGFFCTGGLGGIGTGGSIRNALCATASNAGAGPAFLTAISYLFGLVLAVWGLVKLREHALNPSQVKLSEAISKLGAAAMFLTLPVVISAIRESITPAGASVMANLPISLRGYNESGNIITNIFGANCDGLDGALSCFMKDVLGPFHILLNFFTFTAGTLLIMIGISRMLKGAQEGAKAPAGLGTMMTFFCGGALISYNEFIRVFTLSFFNDISTRTYAQLEYDDGLQTEELEHIHTVISAILKFMIVVGLISFVRGVFMVRSVAEGGGNASMMAATTHLVGGALAINLGPVLNAIQSTLGITGFGVSFS